MGLPHASQGLAKRSVIVFHAEKEEGCVDPVSTRKREGMEENGRV